MIMSIYVGIQNSEHSLYLVSNLRSLPSTHGVDLAVEKVVIPPTEQVVASRVARAVMQVEVSIANKAVSSDAEQGSV